jgi:hypothetical protein
VLAELVVLSHEVIDLAYQFIDAAEGAVPDRLLGDQAEEALDLVQPRAVCGNAVDVPARALGQAFTRAYLWVL